MMRTRRLLALAETLLANPVWFGRALDAANAAQRTARDEARLKATTKDEREAAKVVGGDPFITVGVEAVVDAARLASGLRTGLRLVLRARAGN